MKRILRNSCIISCVLFACFSAGAQDAPSAQLPATASQPQIASQSNAVPGPLMSPLSAGDQIDYSVYGVPEMTQRVRINAEGSVYLPLLNDVQIAGLTSEQAQKKLEDLLVNG
jgi:protein involved in polysaccharide export with SLBB domain